MRRLFPYILIFTLACSNTKEQPIITTNDNEKLLEKLYDASQKPFYHGVASGDPLSDKVIIWTRVTPEHGMLEIEVDWEMAVNINFNEIIATGHLRTTNEQDFTVKVDVAGLLPNTQYFYRFKSADIYSKIGKTKTAPVQAMDSLKFAVISCSNFEFGYFNAYRSLANRNDLDAILHLGDYIYEYGVGVYGDTLLGRKHIPETEVVSLQDYRTRFSQYHLDTDLQAAHQNHPFIAIWDDHEIANNAYKDGAKNHQPEEGTYADRKGAAKRAYYEWLPIRESDKLYRKYSYGGLVDLIMLDERLAGRTAPVKSVDDPKINDTTRTMLGKEQLVWLNKQLTESEAQWKIIGNQVIFSYLNWGFPGWGINMDSWDGYPEDRNIVKKMIVDNKLENIVFVTGDTHSSWAFEVTDNPFENYDAQTGEGAFAVEFGTTSINSSNSDEEMSADSVKIHEEKIVESELNPHLKYANLRDHGYLVITPTKESIKAEWVYVETLKEKSGATYLAKQLSVKSGTVDIE